MPPKFHPVVDAVMGKVYNTGRNGVLWLLAHRRCRMRDMVLFIVFILLPTLLMILDIYRFMKEGAS